MKPMLRVWVWGAVAVCVALSGVRAAVYGDAVVAVVEDEVITVYDLQEAAREEEEEFRHLYAGEELRQRLMALRKAVAQRLVERELIHAEFRKLGAKVPLELVQERMDRIIQSRCGGDRRQFEELLAKEHLTYAEFEAKIEKGVAVDLLLNERVFRHVRVTPEEIERYYAEHGSELERKPGVRLEAIVLKKEDGRYSDTLEATVAEIYSRLRSGAAFGDLARTYSEGKGADAGGDQGWIAAPAAKLKEAIEGLAVGDTAPRALDLGANLYILRLAERSSGGVPPLDDVLRGRIEEKLKEEMRETRYTAFVGQLRGKYFVKTPDDFVDTPETAP